MADKSEKHDAAHSVFGLNEPTARPTKPGAVPSPNPASPASPTAVTTGQPQYVYVQPPARSGSGTSTGMKVLVAVLLILSGANLYLALWTRSAFKETQSKHSEQLDLLTRRLDSSDDRYARLSATFQVVTRRLSLTQQELSNARSLASEIQKQQQAAVRELNSAIAKKASTEEVNKLQADTNTKVVGLSGDIAGTRKDLEDTKAALAGTKGELTGAIARTHDELVALAHKGDQDYFEFRLQGKKAHQKVGGVILELNKTDLKRNTFAVTLVFDDKSHPHKDRTTNEPLFFYVSGAQGPLQLVVNKLGKDSIAGYLSAPKGLYPTAPSVLTARPGL